MGLANSKVRQKTNRIRNSLFVLLGLILVLLTVLGFKTYNIYQTELPSFEQLHNIEPSIKTKLYDRNGILLKEFYIENRILTPYKDFPPHLVEMLLASEDREFYNHWGINVRRIGMVAFKNIIQWRIAAGASTITQQLSRMIFLNRKQTLERKIKEALTAIKLERSYSKNEILEMYLNQYYFGKGAYGIAAAAHVFFSKTVPELTVSDCAIIIGLLKGPNINSPIRHPEKSLKARNRVLFSLHQYGGLTREVYDSLKAEPLTISPPVEKVGHAPYFTETIRKYILDTYGEEMLYSGGLKVYTSLDLDLQADAEKAMYKKIDELRARISKRYTTEDKTYSMVIPDTVDEYGDEVRMIKPVQGAFISIDNSNGDVLAMIGGRSFKETKFNRAVQSLLQPGSCFKPFVYTACIDNGFTTTEIIDDNPIVLDIPGSKQWRPHNFDNKFRGPITMREGLQFSRNLIAIRLILKIKPEQAIFYARNMGITTPLEPVPSLALGSAQVRLIEMVSAFSIYPNQGIHVPTRLIHKIVNRYGQVIEDNTSVKKEEVLSAQTAFIMASMMQSVVTGGTGRGSRWRGFMRPAGGKTGTSNNFCDNWFIGYTPQITTGCWVGFDEKISLGRNQDGAKNGVPIWTEYMIAAHDSLPIMEFEEPEGIVHQDICIETGEIATDRCVKVREEVYIEGTEPTETCSLHPSAGRYKRGSSQSGDEFNADDTTDERTHF